MSTPPPLKAQLLQMDLHWEAPEENFAAAERLLTEAQGLADLIVLPEMFSTGFTMQPAPVAEAVDGPAHQFMRRLAAERDALVIASVVTEEGGHYFNRLHAVRPDGHTDSYDKRHLFRMAGEHEQYTAGQAPIIVEWRGWRICPLVCYDLRFPIWSRNRLKQGGGYDLLVYVANWPAPRVSHWELLLQARAVENQAYCIGVNRVGEDGNEVPYVGGSMAVDPKGEKLAHRREEACVLEVQLDYAEMARYREKFPAWQDADDFRIS